MAELGEVDKVPAHHVGEVGHSWREDRLHPEASDLFVNIAGRFDLETWHFHIHHFVLKGENDENIKVYHLQCGHQGLDCVSCQVCLHRLDARVQRVRQD